jgi:hypothetical protein
MDNNNDLFDEFFIWLLQFGKYTSKEVQRTDTCNTTHIFLIYFVYSLKYTN